jgi:hypothetical protein
LALALQPYNFEIVRRSGKKHIDADTLSRNPVDPLSADTDHLAFEDHLLSLTLAPFSSKKIRNSEFAALQKKDPEFKPIFSFLKEWALFPDRTLIAPKFVEDILYVMECSAELTWMSLDAYG